MAKKDKQTDTPATQAPANEIADLSAGNTTLGLKNTDAVDSLGNPSASEVPPGPKGKGSENIQDSKPKVAKVVNAKKAPEAPAQTEHVVNTDQLDSANNEIADEHSYVPGPRGHGSEHSPDSFRKK